MAEQGEHGITWCTTTWNPVRGCSRVSEGCRFCYAERVAARFSGPGEPYEGLAKNTPAGPRWTGVVRLIPEHLDDPLRWRRPRMVFVNSMSDLFHESLPFEEISAVFCVMAAAPRHTFQVLTKRPARMLEWSAWWVDRMGSPRESPLMQGVIKLLPQSAVEALDAAPPRWPPPNVWLGTSVEDEKTLTARFPALAATPAAVHFLSYEPALGPIDLEAALVCGECGARKADAVRRDDTCGDCGSEGGWGGVEWVICGAESGPGARPMHPAWARSVRDQCVAAGVPFFMKQLSGPNGRAIKDISLFPSDLQVREFPNA